ncbi:hypothetical protein SAMN05216262_11918 [Colwellia chukchiensis]|uniref:Uncharacterized protein n=1 Tax=Colwellia chukchiensis TaxID=641665 RepID=A0A1H7SIV9_9GAMM|nr:hypothetical protein [Colwellia chukchiensis]SEL72378.1 hypothetical protein SAMN05216262_11918 [Colwellia chukchiensis]
MSIKIVHHGKLPALAGFRHADKATHAIYGAFAAAGGSVIANLFDLNSVAVPVASAAAFAVGKEIYDEKVRNKQWKIWDVIAIITSALIYAAVVSK